jgi:Flp pilus assembly protein CpaB
VPWWAATVALAAATGLLVDGVLQRADEAEARWGVPRSVVVAVGPLVPGDPLAGATEVRRLPGPAVPAGALTSVPPGATAVAAIGPGEVVTRARVGGPGAATLAGRLPAGTRAVVVPVEVAGLPVRVGDRVDLLAAGRAGDVAFGEAAVPPTGPVAEGAEVVAVRTGALVVALDERDAAAVAAALGVGPLVPALVGAGDR